MAAGPDNRSKHPQAGAEPAQAERSKEARGKPTEAGGPKETGAKPHGARRKPKTRIEEPTIEATVEVAVEAAEAAVKAAEATVELAVEATIEVAIKAAEASHGPAEAGGEDATVKAAHGSAEIGGTHGARTAAGVLGVKWAWNRGHTKQGQEAGAAKQKSSQHGWAPFKVGKGIVSRSLSMSEPEHNQLLFDDMF